MTLPAPAQALAAVIAVVVSVLASPVAQAAEPAADPSAPPYSAEVVVPRATGPVTATMHEFRLVSDDSMITTVPELITGQRVSLLWRGLPAGDWLGVLTGPSSSAPVELGLVTVAQSELAHVFSVPAGLATGTYTVSFSLDGRELRPAFTFTVVAAPAPAGEGTPGATSFPTTSGTTGSTISTGQISAPRPGSTPQTGTTPGVTADDTADAAPGEVAEVTAAAQPILSIGGVRTSYHGDVNPFDGSLTVTYTVSNTGDTPVAGNVTLTVRGPFAELASLEDSDMVTLEPGESRTIATDVPGVAQAGMLRLELKLTPDPATASSSELATVYREASAWAIPWTLLAALAAAGAGWFAWSRRRRAVLDVGPAAAGGSGADEIADDAGGTAPPTGARPGAHAAAGATR